MEATHTTGANMTTTTIETAIQDHIDAIAASEARIIAMLDESRDLAIKAGATAITSDIIEALDELDADAAEFEFAPVATDNAPSNYRNLIQICRHNAVSLAA